MGKALDERQLQRLFKGKKQKEVLKAAIVQDEELEFYDEPHKEAIFLRKKGSSRGLFDSSYMGSSYVLRERDPLESFLGEEKVRVFLLGFHRSFCLAFKETIQKFLKAEDQRSLETGLVFALFPSSASEASESPEPFSWISDQIVMVESEMKEVRVLQAKKEVLYENHTYHYKYLVIGNPHVTDADVVATDELRQVLISASSARGEQVRSCLLAVNVAEVLSEVASEGRKVVLELQKERFEVVEGEWKDVSTSRRDETMKELHCDWARIHEDVEESIAPNVLCCEDPLIIALPALQLGRSGAEESRRSWRWVFLQEHLQQVLGCLVKLLHDPNSASQMRKSPLTDAEKIASPRSRAKNGILRALKCLAEVSWLQRFHLKGSKVERSSCVHYLLPSKAMVCLGSYQIISKQWCGRGGGYINSPTFLKKPRMFCYLKKLMACESAGKKQDLGGTRHTKVFVKQQLDVGNIRDVCLSSEDLELAAVEFFKRRWQVHLRLDEMRSVLKKVGGWFWGSSR